jgi:hypothetical protein
MATVIRKANNTIKYLMILSAFVVLLTQLGWTTPVARELIPVQVHAGDTVWSIASTASGGSVDVRHVVWDILKTNHLTDTDHIYPGQVLQVPVDKNNVNRLKNSFDVRTNPLR